MMYCDSSVEKQVREKRQDIEARLARWRGIRARRTDQPPQANPYKLGQDLMAHEALLWCRWVLGWVVEDERLRHLNPPPNS